MQRLLASVTGCISVASIDCWLPLSEKLAPQISPAMRKWIRSAERSEMREDLRTGVRSEWREVEIWTGSCSAVQEEEGGWMCDSSSGL